MTLITTGAAASTNAAFVSDERLYLDKDGKVVREGDPAAVELLVGVNGVLPRARAVELGLITIDQAAQQAHDETLAGLTTEETAPPAEDPASAAGKDKTKG